MAYRAVAMSRNFRPNRIRNSCAEDLLLRWRNFRKCDNLLPDLLRRSIHLDRRLYFEHGRLWLHKVFNTEERRRKQNCYRKKSCSVVAGPMDPLDCEAEPA